MSDVQSNWNKIEEILVRTIDKLAPITEFMGNVSSLSQAIPQVITRKIGQRKRLLRKMRQNPNDELKKRIKNLSKEIKEHFVMNKRKRMDKSN